MIGRKLDLYLAQGYFRHAGGMFSTQIYSQKGELDEVRNIRLNLEHHQFSKSIQKIARRVEKKFSYSIQPFVISPEKEDLYMRHFSKFNSKNNNSLESFLFGSSIYFSNFNSYEVNIYDGDQLIAFSVFDIGKNSIASILGAYNLDYGAYSLGLFTMYLEISWGIKNQYNYYYPGYIMQKNKLFNYKLRLGEYEYFDWVKGCWVSKEDLTPTKGSAQIIEDETSKLIHLLEKVGIPFQYKEYYYFMYGYTSNMNNQFYVKSPKHIYIPLLSNDEKICILEYDIDEKKFVFAITRADESFNHHISPDQIEDNGRQEIRLLEYISIEKTTLAEEIIYKLWKTLNTQTH
ncbi:MAG: arginyl-tRNA--protein transferase [Chitinophagales bacterium]|nr:arginyl-tRNA--protein transferase [Chitinophagales bacterium]